MNWFRSFGKRFTTPLPQPSQPAQPAQPAIEAIGCFTPRAQKVLELSRKEADRFNHNFVGTEHLLLGLIRLGQGTAVKVLTKMGLNLENVRSEVEKQVGTGPDQEMIGIIPYTPRVKRVLMLAGEEANSLNHTYVGTEHILLGLLREGEGVACRVLKQFEADIEQARQMILDELDPIFSCLPIKEPEGNEASTEIIDTSQRYDVYCAERDQEVVYSNVLFKGVKKLLPQKEDDLLSDFLELELPDGKAIFVARSSLMKFRLHAPEKS